MQIIKGEGIDFFMLCCIFQNLMHCYLVFQLLLLFVVDFKPCQSAASGGQFQIKLVV